MVETIKFRFDHGLGDAAHLACTVPLWTRRGYKISVQTKVAYRKLLESAGAFVCEDATDVHAYSHPLLAPFPFSVISGNKVAANLRNDPLPDIGQPHELWDELLAVRLRLPSPSEEASAWIKSQSKPIVVTHLKGSSGVLRKNLADHAIQGVWNGLLRDRTMRDGVIINLDEERLAPPLIDDRVVNLNLADRNWSLSDLAGILDAADLLIGIDSGPLHFARLTEVRALGVWTLNNPVHFALPREKTRHLATVLAHTPPAVVATYQILPSRNVPTADDVVKAALAMLRGNL